MTEKHAYYTILLPPEAREKARKFAAEQATEEKQRQVERNTLAVWAVNSFVREIHFETDLTAGDSWNPVIRGLHNVGDLVLPDLGKLECRPCSLQDTAIALPVEVTEERIAYIAVALEEPAEKAQLLGFVRAADVPESGRIEIEQLEEIENLIDYLFRFESGIEVLREEAEVNEKVQQLLETTPISAILSQLERIYRIEPEYEWRGKGGKVVLSEGATAGASVRESMEKSIDVDEEEKIAAQNLAESLLEKLAEIWGESA